MAMSNRTEPLPYLWHRGENENRIDFGQEPRWGEGEEFIDPAQEERWHGIARQLERGEDASPVVDFLQNETSISPRLRTIIARLWRGEPFHAPDGPRHLKGLQVLKRKAHPFDPRRLEKTLNARSHAWKLMQLQGKKRDAAIKEAAKVCGVTVREVRAAVQESERQEAEE
jgi:hypothetical protein